MLLLEQYYHRILFWRESRLIEGALDVRNMLLGLAWTLFFAISKLTTSLKTWQECCLWWCCLKSRYIQYNYYISCVINLETTSL